jgi:hypothetical protein
MSNRKVMIATVLTSLRTFQATRDAELKRLMSSPTVGDVVRERLKVFEEKARTR